MAGDTVCRIQKALIGLKEVVMKKLYAPVLLAIPLLVAATWIGARTTQEAAQQEPVRLPGYHLESQHIAMAEVGSLLERLGREIQQDERITVGGNSYPVSGFGGIEFSVSRGSRRGGELRTGVSVSFGSTGRTTPPTGPPGRARQDYDPYQGSGRWWAPSDVANLVAELARTLAATGVFVMEDHRVAFRGSASIDQRLTERTPGRRQLYNLEMHVVFGEGEFTGPDDDEDYQEALDKGVRRSLARVQSEDADQDAVAEAFTSLAEDLRAGQIRVGGQEVAVGEFVGFRLTHVTAVDGQYEKIELGLDFGPMPEPRPEGPRYSEEVTNESIRDLATTLRRIAAEILEDGTFQLGDEVFTVSDQASWELYARATGLGLEVGWR